MNEKLNEQLKEACERAAKNLAMDSAHIPSIQQIIEAEISPLFAEMEREKAFALETQKHLFDESLRDALDDLKKERTAREAAEKLAELTAKGSFDASEVMARENASLRAELERVQKVASRLKEHAERCHNICLAHDASCVCRLRSLLQSAKEAGI